VRVEQRVRVAKKARAVVKARLKGKNEGIKGNQRRAAKAMKAWKWWQNHSHSCSGL
jgi:hypothetical protein